MIKKTEFRWMGFKTESKRIFFERRTLLEKNGIFILISTNAYFLKNYGVESSSNCIFYKTEVFFPKNVEFVKKEGTPINLMASLALEKSEANKEHDEIVKKVFIKLQEVENVR